MEKGDMQFMQALDALDSYMDARIQLSTYGLRQATMLDQPRQFYEERLAYAKMNLLNTFRELAKEE